MIQMSETSMDGLLSTGPASELNIFTDQIRNYASFQICARMTKDAYMRHRHSPSLCGCRDRLEALTKRPKRSSGIALAAYITTGSYIIVWGREPRDKTRMR